MWSSAMNMNMQRRQDVFWHVQHSVSWTRGARRTHALQSDAFLQDVHAAFVAFAPQRRKPGLGNAGEVRNDVMARSVRPSVDTHACTPGTSAAVAVVRQR